MAVYEISFVPKPDPTPGGTVDGAVERIETPGTWWTEAQLLAWSMDETQPPGFGSLPDSVKVQLHRRSRQRRWKMMPAWNNLFHVNSRHGEEIANLGLTEVTQAHFDAGQALEAEVAAGRNAFRQWILVMPEYPGGGVIPNLGSVPDPSQPDSTYAPFTQQERRLLKIWGWSKKCLEIEPGIQGMIDRIAQHDGYDTNWGYHTLMHKGVIRVEATPQQIDKITAEETDRTVNALSRRKMVSKHTYRFHYETFLTPLQITALEDRDLLIHVDRTSPPVPITSVMELIPRSMTNVPEGSGMGEDPV